jgi:hypothetical protein
MPNPYRHRYQYNNKTHEVEEIKMPTRASRRKGAGWPMRSEALGVMPGQQAAAIHESRLAGCPTHFDSDGRAVFEDRNHRKKYCEAFGYFDKDAGYGDPQRR